jgi:hypothetical protein
MKGKRESADEVSCGGLQRGKVAEGIGISRNWEELEAQTEKSNF